MDPMPRRTHVSRVVLLLKNQVPSAHNEVRASPTPGLLPTAPFPSPPCGPPRPLHPASHLAVPSVSRRYVPTISNAIASGKQSWNLLRR